MSKHCSAYGNPNSRLKPRIFKRPLQHRFMEMMPALLSGDRIHVMARGWKDPLPSPLLLGVGIFSFERVR